MKSKIILIAILALISNVCIAAWSKVTTNDEAIIYTDLTTVQKTADTVKVWELEDLIKSRPGEDFLSSKSLNEIDCKAKKSRVISFVMYAGHMANGKVIRSSEAIHAWLPIGAGGAVEFLSIATCK